MKAEPLESGGPNPTSCLFGKRVVNTRSPSQAPELDELLRHRGAVPLSYPCIDIAPPQDAGVLGHALAQLAAGRFDWLVLTSANAVRALAGAVEAEGAMDQAPLVPRALNVARARVAVVGPETAASARALLNLSIDLEPKEYTAQAVAAELVARGAREVLLPVSDRARDTLPRVLGAHGADVTTVIAYRTILGRGGVDLATMLRRSGADAITFTSPSTVENLAIRLEQEGGDWSLVRSTCIACIGPVTSQAAARQGLKVQVQPREHTVRGLVDALEGYFSRASQKEGFAHA
jgi:uroporphyrinogen-III synthase